MASKFVFIYMLTFTCLMAFSNAARQLPHWNLQHSAMAELDEASNSTNGTLGNCWSAVAEIKSCGNEIDHVEMLMLKK